MQQTHGVDIDIRNIAHSLIQLDKCCMQPLEPVARRAFLASISLTTHLHEIAWKSAFAPYSVGNVRLWPPQ